MTNKQLLVCRPSPAYQKRPRLERSNESDFRCIDWDTMTLATTLFRLLAPSLIDENATHGLGRRGEKMSATVPMLGLRVVHQPQISLVHQRRGLQRLPRLFVGELLGS